MWPRSKEVVQINGKAANRRGAVVLFGRGTGPPAEAAKIRKRRIAVVMGVPLDSLFASNSVQNFPRAGLKVRSS